MEPQVKTRLDAAFEAFAQREMPWLLAPEDDSEKLMRTTALIAFARGYEVGTQHSDGTVGLSK